MPEKRDKRTNTRCYTLLSSHTDVWELYEACKNAGVDARIAPTPRVADAHASCGTSLLIDCGNKDDILALADDCGISTHGVIAVENAINPHRDRYC